MDYLLSKNTLGNSVKNLLYPSFVSLFFLILLGLEGQVAMATSLQSGENKRILQVTNTVYGKIEIIEANNGNYEILLNGKELFRGNEKASFIRSFSSTSPRPEVAKVLALAGKYPSQIVVFQQFNNGNECEGNEIWFLEVMHNTYRISTPIGKCFGTRPKIWSSKNKVFVDVDGGYPGGNKNRMVSYKQGGLWVYETGKVKRLK